MRTSLLWMGIVLLFSAVAREGVGQNEGFLKKGADVLFPLGFYELPADEDSLRKMAEAGVNLVRCSGREDLDRASSVGMMGVAPVPLENGPTQELRQTVESLRDHPALAVWEGPDEVVWNFTAASQLYKTRGIHSAPGEWRKQTENAVDYARRQADAIVPNMREAVRMIRELDPTNRPVWINEAVQSDLGYVRECLPFVDITGCDIYPVKKETRPIHRMGSATDRWMQVGRGKPVWMVLQAFAWSELGDYYGVQETAYPSFSESRFMAYDVLAHGARGILYWGSSYLKSEPFRQSLYALTRELSALQPFLVSPLFVEAKVNLVEFREEETPLRGVKPFVRKLVDDWLIVLVNEDNEPHLGVEVTGLGDLNGRTLERLYGRETVMVRDGELLTRMQPYEVKVFATGRRWESEDLSGRDFGGS